MQSDCLLKCKIQNYSCIAVENGILCLKHTYVRTSGHKVGHFFIKTHFFTDLGYESFFAVFLLFKMGNW